MDPSIPNNEGFFRPIKVLTIPGSFVECTHPAPVAARGLGATRVTDCLWGALARMLPQKVFACGVQGDYGVTIAGYRPDGRAFVNLEFLYSGWGGRPDKDGIDGISSLAVNYSNTPAEVVEVEQPIRIERYEFRCDSGGAGKYRGSVGIVRDYRLVGGGRGGAPSAWRPAEVPPIRAARRPPGRLREQRNQPRRR